jgi:hypothetical protein
MPIDRKTSTFEKAPNIYKNYEDAHFMPLGGMNVFVDHLEGGFVISLTIPPISQTVVITNRRNGHG